MTRTQNSFFNMAAGIGSSLLTVLLNFVTRSVFIRTLGTSYLGIEGYFSNILTMLSLTELGFGTAIVFKLYKPLEEQDRPRILVLMKLYRRVYQIVGCVIAALGIILIPFLPVLVKDYDTFAELGLNAVGIFLLYLFRSACSYWFFSYKTVYLTANQKSYVLTTIGFFFNIANSLTQIAVLLLTGNFVLYIIVQVVFLIAKNIVSAHVSVKRYPIINEKTDDKISREELKDFFKDCSALLLYRIEATVISASDNLVLTALSGLTATGLYANYLSLKTAVRGLLENFSSSFRASLGSMYSTGNLEWTRLIFRVVNFLSAWLYGIGAIGIALLTNDFILLWLRDPGYVVTSWTGAGGTLVTPVALLLGIELYLSGQIYYCDVCRNAMGLFRQLKYRPIASIVINLGVGIATVPYIGLAGCVFSTIVAYVTTNLIVDPIVIHKHALKQPVGPYFARNILYAAALAAAGLLCRWLCALVALEGIAGFIVRGCICAAVPSAVFCLCFFRTREFRYLLRMGRDFLSRLPSRGSKTANKGDNTHDA